MNLQYLIQLCFNVYVNSIFYCYSIFKNQVGCILSSIMPPSNSGVFKNGDIAYLKYNADGNEYVYLLPRNFIDKVDNKQAKPKIVSAYLKNTSTDEEVDVTLILFKLAGVNQDLHDQTVRFTVRDLCQIVGLKDAHNLVGYHHSGKGMFEYKYTELIDLSW